MVRNVRLNEARIAMRDLIMGGCTIEVNDYARYVLDMRVR